MKLSTLASVFTAYLVTAAPAPEPMDITISLNSGGPVHPTPGRQWPVNLRFVGADPTAFYDLTETVSVDKSITFKVGLSALFTNFYVCFRSDF